MSDKSEYMREYMRLKRLAAKAGVSHLPIGEIKELETTGKLIASATNGSRPATSKVNQASTEYENNGLWLGIAVGILILALTSPFIIAYFTRPKPDKKNKNNQANN